MSADSQARFTKLSLEARSGLLLLAAAILALVAANGPFSKLYDGLLEVPLSVAIGALSLEKPLLLWINDGLMAIFFLMIGLEVRREMTDGSLVTWSQRTLAFAIPYHGPQSPAYQLEKALHSWVSFLILPVFAFANAGVGLAGLNLAGLSEPVTLGVILGLVLGKQLGVFGFSWLAAAVGFCKRPEGASWLQVYGVAALCGVGFTMSLCIGALAFEHLPQPELLTANRLGILIGSAVAGLLGYGVLRFAPKPKEFRDVRGGDG